MTVGAEPGDRLASVRPLVVGDLIDGRRVAGFAWTEPVTNRAHYLEDRLLLDGDQECASPPDRPVPQSSEGAEPAGVVPPADLPNGHRHLAASIDPTLPLRTDLLLDLPGAPWQPLARSLLAAVHATGHLLWLSGGATRDLVSGVPLHEINDLDLAGTVPTGRFTDITYQTMRATRMTEFRTTVCPDILVCTVVPPWSNVPVIEYRGLSQGGFQFPAVGSRISEDTRHRDFSFNALLYDALDHVVMDGCGTGLQDLRSPRRRFSPQNVSRDPATLAMVLLRAVKFALRWSGNGPHDLEPLVDWVSALPPDFFDSLTVEDWNGLVATHHRSVHASVDQQKEFAALLPEPGRMFVETLIKRVS